MARVFVIMPFSLEFDSVFELLVRPSLEAEGLEVVRADTLDTRQNILKDVIGGIAGADLIVADVSAPNPNVYYELGVAHGLSRPTLLITQAVEDVPFDLRSYRLLVYSTHIARVDDVKRELGEVARGFLEGRTTFGSPVSDFAAVEGVAGIRSGPILARMDAPESSAEDEAEGVLDYICRVEESSQNMTSAVEAIAASIGEVGEKVQGHADRMGALGDRADAPRAALAVSLATAHDLTTFAAALEGQLPAFEASATNVADGFSAYADWLARTPGADPGDASELVGSARGALQSTTEAMASTRGLRDSMLAQKGFSRELSRGIQRAADALDAVLSVLERVQAHYARVIEVGEGIQASSTHATEDGAAKGTVLE
jgi:hypothetical protein